MRYAFTVVLASLFALPLLAQQSAFTQPQATVQMQCRDLASSGNYIGPDEAFINGMACHPVRPSPQTDSAPKLTVSNLASPPKPSVNPAPQPATATPDPAPAVAPTPPPADGKKRLFVTDEPMDETTFIAQHRSGWQVSGNSSGQISGSGGSVGAAAGHSQKGADPRTVEVQADIYKSCLAIVVTNDPSKADYLLLFRREGGKRSTMFAFGGLTGLALSAHSKVDGASVFNSNGDMVFATRERTVDHAIKAVCAHLN